jgi:glucokinase
MATYLLGIEIGGTKLQVGLGDLAGNLLHCHRALIRPEVDAAEVRDTVAQLIARVLGLYQLRRSEIACVGIGFGGPVDAARGTVLKSHQVAGWEGFPLTDWVRETWGWPAVLQNDADTAGLAEAVRGAGVGYDPIFYITVGTGVGGGLIWRREIYRGSGLGAGEIGHLPIVPVDPQDLSGRWWVTEELASGKGIAERAREAVQRDPAAGHTLLRLAGDLRDIRAELVLEAARWRDPLCERLVHQAVQALARAICAVVALLCPARIIIGGGVAQAGEELFWKPLRAEVQRVVFRPFANAFELVPSQLGQEVVVHGALELARQLYTSQCTAA